MNKRICVHMGPHKTGSSAIQTFLSNNSMILSEQCGVACYEGAELSKITKALQDRDWIAVHHELLAFREKVLSRPEKTILVSSEDISGQLPGRSATRAVYPRLESHVNLIKKAFPELTCNFFFFLRQEEAWLKSVYAQNLRFRQNFVSREKFDSFIKFKSGWDAVTEKVRSKHGDEFVTLPYLEDMNFSAEKALLNAIGVDIDQNNLRPNSKRINLSANAKQLRIFETINRSDASNQAKKDAKMWMLDPSITQHEGCGGLAGPPWPYSFSAKLVHAELESLAERASSRVYTQSEQPWLLPSPDLNFDDIREELVDGVDEFPGGNRQDMTQQEKILKYRFRNQPQICFIVSFAISYLRRSTQHTEDARKLFFRAWETEYPLLLATLPTRWLISTLQTFIDHGRSSDEKMIGASGYFFANTLKIYEAERALEGIRPDSKYPKTSPDGRNGFPGMDRFELGGSDIMVNTLALLLELTTKDQVSGRVLQEFLVRTKRANTVFSRMDKNRIQHQVNNPQFDNCWSFFEDPRPS